MTAPSEDEDRDGSDMVEKLVERFQSSVRTEDRRDALRTLKALSRKYRLEVGTKAMPSLVDTLKSEREDSESVCYALESLYSVMNDSDNGQDKYELINTPTDLGCQFAEIFIKQNENIDLVVSCVDIYELHVRRHALRLLTLLLLNQRKSMQNAILRSPRAISKVVDVLSDPREALRNDALLLLIELTKSNVNIQKIVAFENTFEVLLSIIQSEGWSHGSVIIEDCLRLMWQLLNANAPNQVLFKENNFIKRLIPLIDIGMDGTEESQHWSTQTLVNIELAMQVLRTLVSPRNKVQDTRTCQTNMLACGVLQKLSDILMTNEVPADVLTQAIYVVADIIRGCTQNQAFLAQVIAPSAPPQPVITILLISMVNDRQALPVRVAALYCFQSYIHANPQIQSAIVMTLLPTTVDSTQTISIGQLLCGGLFAQEPLSNWFSAVSLSHCICDNAHLKEELLRVHLASQISESPTSLLQQCFVWFQEHAHFQTRIGLLIFLCTWLADCPLAVRCFLDPSTTSIAHPSDTSGIEPKRLLGANLSSMLADMNDLGNDESDILVKGLLTLLTCLCILFNPDNVVGFDKNSIITTLEKRLGLDVVLEHLNQISKTQWFTAASKQPDPDYQKSTDLVFDFNFTRLFKRLEYEIIRTLQPTESIPSVSATLVNELEQKLHLKDTEVSNLRIKVNSLESELVMVRSQIQSPFPAQPSEPLERTLDSNCPYDSQPSLNEQISQLIQDKQDLQSELDDLLLMMHDQDMKIGKLKLLVRQLGGQADSDSEPEDHEVSPSITSQIKSIGTAQITTTASLKPSGPNLYNPVVEHSAYNFTNQSSYPTPVYPSRNAGCLAAHPSYQPAYGHLPP